MFSVRASFLILLLSAVLFGFTEDLHAARIGDISDSDIREQAARFFSFQDPAVRYAVAGSILLGICCGLLGSFIVVRKMALVGDTLSHAVLPGVALGFLWNMTKDPMAIFIGATVAGLIGTGVVNLIKQTTRLKEDTALGMVLAGFYAVGICLMTMIQQLPTGNVSGIDKFLFGQAAAIGFTDLKLMAVVTGLSLLIIGLFYKEFLLSSFDAGFARVAGFPVQMLHYTLMLLLAFAVVISLQAVGVVLVSAMLIIPAAAAYLLTDRLHKMIWLAAGFGMLAGVVGAFFSFLGPALPTGPFMVLGASVVFGAAFFFSPKHGVLTRWWRQRSHARQIHRENTLKSIYHVLEGREFKKESVTLTELKERRNESLEEARERVQELVSHRLATFDRSTNEIHLTPDGWQRACEIVRNHRLWELYLTNAAQIAADHVHDDAEKIEHVLGEDVVRQLEKRLNFATKDPHGRDIPGLQDIERGKGTFTRPEETIGYGRRP